MPSTHRRKYGIDWEKGMSDYAIEKSCYRWGVGKAQGGLGQYGHFRNSVQLAFKKNEFKYNDFADKIIWYFIKYDLLNIWSCGGVGKSTTVAAIAAIFLDAAPEQTLISVFTSQLGKQDLRVFGEVARFNDIIKRRMPDTPTRYIPSEHRIVYDDPNHKRIKKAAGIFAFGVGNKDDRHKANSMSGLHNTFNMRIVDELNACDNSVMELANFFQGGQEHKVIVMQNPDDWGDLGGKHSIPVQGIENISPDVDETWESTTGFQVLFLDGLKCPSLVEENGERKYPFFPSRSGIEKTRKMYGEDSLQWWQQVRGFMPPQSLRTDRVMTMAMATQFGIQKDVELAHVEAAIASFDPATTDGGDRKVLTFADIGKDFSGRDTCRFDGQEDIKVGISKAEEFTILLAKEVIKRCKARGVQKKHLAVDVSGSDGIADTIDILWDEEGSVHRVFFNGPATDRPISTEDRRLAKDVYDRRVTELWMMFRQFAIANQLRSVPEKALKQFCDRKVDKRYKKLCIIAKSKMSGHSPDEADSIVVMLDMLRERFGWDPDIMFTPAHKKRIEEHWRDRYVIPDEDLDPTAELDDDLMYTEYDI